MARPGTKIIQAKLVGMSFPFSLLFENGDPLGFDPRINLNSSVFPSDFCAFNSPNLWCFDFTCSTYILT